MYPRFVETRLSQALADTPVVALNGPRQAGKTTLVRKIAAADRTYLTLDEASTLAAARTDPTAFVRNLDRAAIDEVQRAPELMLAIKRSVDEDRRPGRFLLTGSAHILTVRNIRESLAGRMEVIPLLPLARSEILDRGEPAFLAHAFAGRLPQPPEAPVGKAMMGIVLGGGYPDALARASVRRRRDWGRSYIEAITERDVPEISAIERGNEMPRLLAVLAQHAGQLVNFASLGGELGLNRKTVERYVEVLEQLFLVKRLPPWSRNELNRLVKTPKLHFLDSGLLAAIRNLAPERLAADRGWYGALLETYVFAELQKMAAWHDDSVRFHHYRDKDQVEVDLVLEDTMGGVVGVEIKAGATVQASDFRGLRRLAALAGPSMKLGVLLYDGAQVLPFGDRLYAAPLSVLWSPR